LIEAEVVRATYHLSEYGSGGLLSVEARYLDPNGVQKTITCGTVRPAEDAPPKGTRMWVLYASAREAQLL
jgi:hypothetical protein